MRRSREPDHDLGVLLQDDERIDEALRQAALDAIREHKEKGLPLAMWRDGRVVWMSAEEVEAEIDDAA